MTYVYTLCDSVNTPEKLNEGIFNGFKCFKIILVSFQFCFKMAPSYFPPRFIHFLCESATQITVPLTKKLFPQLPYSSQNSTFHSIRNRLDQKDAILFVSLFFGKHQHPRFIFKFIVAACTYDYYLIRLCPFYKVLCNYDHHKCNWRHNRFK